MINKFRGKYYFLSNYYESPVEYNGITYLNNEAAFQAQKTTDINERIKFSNLDPSEAKKLGRKISLRKDWEEVKENYMYKIVKAKFAQNLDIKQKLIDTYPNELIEGTTGWHDNIWGNCECHRCKNIVGQNKLGKILMKVREELMNV